MNADVLNEVKFLTSRSSGPGGQHVNKTESKVELHWPLEESAVLTDSQKAILRERIGNKLTTEGVLILYCQETRSQIQNKEIVSNRFLELIARMLKPAKKRVPTRRSRASVERRLQAKKQKGDRKRDRGKPGAE